MGTHCCAISWRCGPLCTREYNGIALAAHAKPCYGSSLGSWPSEPARQCQGGANHGHRTRHQRRAARGRRAARDAAALGHPRRGRPDRHQVWLRGAAMRRLHRPYRRDGDPLLRDPGRRRRAAQVTTIEGLDPDGNHPVQSAWREATCRSAAIARAARSCRRRRCWPRTQSPSDQDITEAMSGNICRCGIYQRIRAAIKRPAQGRCP